MQRPVQRAGSEAGEQLETLERPVAEVDHDRGDEQPEVPRDRCVVVVGLGRRRAVRRVRGAVRDRRARVGEVPFAARHRRGAPGWARRRARGRGSAGRCRRRAPVLGERKWSQPADHGIRPLQHAGPGRWLDPSPPRPRSQSIRWTGSPTMFTDQVVRSVGVEPPMYRTFHHVLVPYTRRVVGRQRDVDGHEAVVVLAARALEAGVGLGAGARHVE